MGTNIHLDFKRNIELLHAWLQYTEDVLKRPIGQFCRFLHDRKLAFVLHHPKSFNDEVRRNELYAAKNPAQA